MADNFNIPSFCCIFVSSLITSIEARNVRFFTFVFSVKGKISVILILVVEVYQQILSSTEQGFIGLLRGNQTSIFVPKGGGGPCVFYQPHFQMLRPAPTILFDQSLYSSCIRKSTTLMFMSFSKKNHAFVAKLGNFLLVSVRHVRAHPGEHQHGVSIQISISLGKIFLRISRIRNIPLT